MNKLSRITLVALTSLGALAATGCADMTHDQKATAVGAVVGGVAGSALTGTTLGTVGGAAVGGVVGHEVGKNH